MEARSTTRASFWAEPTISVFDPRHEAMTALEAAASIGDIETFDEVHNAGADTAAWRSERPHEAIPSQPSVSFLSLPSPLHRAVENDQHPAVHHLLDLSFSPDVFPLASVPYSLNPAVTAIASLNLSAYNLRAPLKIVHILYFAAATLSLDLFLKVAEDVPLQKAPLTALLHTLLHIIYLPLNDTYINHYSAKCHVSIHELRSLNHTTRIQILHPHPPPNQLSRCNINSSLSPPSTSSLSNDHPA